MKQFLLCLFLVVSLINASHAQREFQLVGEDGEKHTLRIVWDDPDFVSKWRLMLFSPGFLIGSDGAVTNRFEAFLRPVKNLSLQAHLSIPYTKKLDFERESNTVFENQTVSSLQYSVKAGYTFISGQHEKMRKTQVGGNGNVAYVAEIPRTIRNGVEIVAGYDFYRSPSSFQVGMNTINESAFSGYDDYYCINGSSSNIVGGLAFSRDQSYGVSLDGDNFAFGGTLKAFLLVAANISSSSDLYVLKSRLNYDTQVTTTSVEESTNQAMNDLVTFQKRMGIRMGVDYFLSRPQAPVMNTFFFGMEIGSLPYYQLNNNQHLAKGYASFHFGYGFGQRLEKKIPPAKPE